MSEEQPTGKRTIKKTSRFQALQILEKTEKSGSYSNLLLNEAIQKNNLTPADARLMTELVYGVLQHKITLDYYLSRFVKKNQKVDPWVSNLLRMSVYQMVYLERIPSHAILFEAVEIAKKRGHVGISKFVNGILRNAERKGFPAVEDIEDPIERLGVTYSLPKWLVEKFVHEIGYEETEALGESLLMSSHSSARVNRKLTTVQEALDYMEEEGFYVRQSELSTDGIVSDSGHFASSELFKNGKITIQDETSMLVAPALQVEPHHQVLDACAAPGGKTTHIAAYLSKEAGGKVTALDLHKHKVKLINENARRLQVDDVVEGLEQDARKVKDVFEDETFDRILVDAPCSGLGLMRRKPDIKYTKRPEDFDQLHNIQMAILNEVAPKLKSGGLLVYSTCTIIKEENHQTVAAFLSQHPEFEKEDVFVEGPAKDCLEDNLLTIYPHHFDSDGFFISALRKK